MAEHVDTEQLDETLEAVDEPATVVEPTAGRRRPRVPVAVAVGLLLVVATGALASWLGWRSHHTEAVAAQDNLYIQTARQAALNLTTISYTEADADIKRILDSSTGSFRDDFQQRSGPFVQVVKQARSKSEGTVTAAGLESTNGNAAQVLLAISVKTSMGDAPAGEPRNWRMRVSVEKDGDGAKVSNVQFVP